MALHTRPTPEELLDGVLHTLEQRIRPLLEEAQQQDQIGSAIGVLRYLRARWNTAVSDLLEESTALESLLADAVAPLRDTGESEAASRLESLATTGSVDATYAALAQRVDELHEGLLVLVRLADLADPGSALAGMRGRILAELSAVNDRRA